MDLALDAVYMSSIGLCDLCNEKAQLTCSACSTVFYCSTEHQQENWLNHRDVCRAYKVETSSKLGQHLVAARNLRKDDQIFRENPLAIGPALMGAIPWSCPGCHRAIFPEGADSCPGCQWPVCSRKCAGLEDPELHGSECELLKIVKRETNACRMGLLLPLRCLILQTTKPKKWALLENIALKARFQNVNSEPSREATMLQNDLKRISKAASHIVPDCSSTTIKNVFSLLNLSGRGLFTPSSGPLAAVYAVSSLLVHSCVPNVTITFEIPEDTAYPSRSGCGRATIQASRDIRRGEILTYPLVNLFCSTLDRLKELMTVRNFHCLCARCIDPTELGTHSGTLKCLGCPGYILPVNPEKIENCDWVCDKGCGKKLTNSKVLNLHHGLFLHIGRIRLEEGPTTDRLELLVDTLEKYIHPRHYLCMTVKHLLSKTYGEKKLRSLTMEQLLRKSALSKEVWTTMSDPNVLIHGATIVAECLLEHCRANFEILKRKFKSKEWNSDRVVREIIECRSLLLGIPEVCRPDHFYPPRARLVKAAAEQHLVIVAWATAKRLELPGK